MKSAKKRVEENHDRSLTTRQVTFCRYMVEGIHSNAASARLAGYAADSSNVMASKLLNGRDFPHVPEYIEELRAERERRYGVTTIGQLQRLHELSSGAEDAGQFSAAINAEKIRAALGGLTVDRREQISTIDSLSRDEILTRLTDLQKKYPQAFQIEGDFTVVEEVPAIEAEVVDVTPEGDT